MKGVGTDAVLVLADFGESLDVSAFKTFKLPNPFEGRAGAQHYWAPEIASAIAGPGETINYEKNDVFAVGMVADQMLGGHPPPSPTTADFIEALRNPDFDARMTVDQAIRALGGMLWPGVAAELLQAFDTTAQPTLELLLQLDYLQRF